MTTDDNDKSIALVNWDAHAIPKFLHTFRKGNELVVARISEPSKGDPQAARVNCLRWAIEQIKQRTPYRSTYLLLAMPNWETPSRILKYYGLAKSILRTKGHELLKQGYNEFSVLKNGLIKYWLIVKLPESSLAEANALLLGYDGVLLILDGSPTLSVLQEAVDRETGADNSLTKAAAMFYIHREGTGFCVAPTGGFDDTEIQVYVFGGGNVMTAFDCAPTSLQ
jgi:hypothetical protein